MLDFFGFFVALDELVDGSCIFLGGDKDDIDEPAAVLLPPNPKTDDRGLNALPLLLPLLLLLFSLVLLDDLRVEAEEEERLLEPPLRVFNIPASSIAHGSVISRR